MIVWQALYEIGVNGKGSSYHASKHDANVAVKDAGGGSTVKIDIKNRHDAAYQLNAAVNEGGIAHHVSSDDDDFLAS